jgi:hypothetical protein
MVSWADSAGMMSCTSTISSDRNKSILTISFLLFFTPLCPPTKPPRFPSLSLSLPHKTGFAAPRSKANTPDSTPAAAAADDDGDDGDVDDDDPFSDLISNFPNLSNLDFFALNTEIYLFTSPSPIPTSFLFCCRFDLQVVVQEKRILLLRKAWRRKKKGDDENLGKQQNKKNKTQTRTRTHKTKQN